MGDGVDGDYGVVVCVFGGFVDGDLECLWFGGVDGGFVFGLYGGF